MRTFALEWNTPLRNTLTLLGLHALGWALAATSLIHLVIGFTKYHVPTMDYFNYGSFCTHYLWWR